ncbi:uncharacterized protein APUU_20488S [Aspergillus puulaauensis]|uniref:Uncharacterized protein n=1 Tax=Aspergillus puulaauensis TaxID=1220207 RepID=A0A7R7XEP9_9EURO|nr:uncharacterized protein APUU_20488S [Aspergillus puulaauensis]BCS20056.1 hypothetical protein APUU_20488S [Aspergillus puulaauensis]
MVRDQPLIRPKSRLEALPAEIIQEIFLRCLEINLPRASIHLARALSNPVIYIWLIKLAFAKADGDGESIHTRHFLPPHDIVGYVGGDGLKELRTQILECRWCTLPLIRRCQLAFLQHVIQYKRPDFNVVPNDQHHLAAFAKWFDNPNPCYTTSNGQRGERDLVLRANRPGSEFNESDPKRSHDYNVAVWFNLGIVEVFRAREGDPKGKIYFELPYCEGSHLPDKLLCAPWTKEKLEFLQLISTRAFLDRDTNYDRATRTLRRLIRDRDFPIFARLLDIYVRIECYGFPIIWPTNNMIFRAALKHADEQGDPFVRLLVEERWDHIESEGVILKEKLMRKMLSWGYI